MNKALTIKVCGMRDVQNIKDISALAIDWIGLIFHPESLRYIGNEIPENLLASFPKHLKKAGVFVEQSAQEILVIAKQWKLDIIQLHGNYSVKDAQMIRQNYPIIKVFAPTSTFDWSIVAEYENEVDFLLFDTAGKHPGGNGIAFDWSLLSNYKGNTPFLLSGGIGLDDVKEIMTFQHPQFVGIDLNSRFEDAPALKNIFKIKIFLEQLNLKHHA